MLLKKDSWPGLAFDTAKPSRAIFSGFRRLLEKNKLPLPQGERELSAKELHLLSIDQYEYACRQINEIGRLLGGWQRSCEKPAKSVQGTTGPVIQNK